MKHNTLNSMFSHLSARGRKWLFLMLMQFMVGVGLAQTGPLTAVMDPLSTSACCTFSQPCSCTAGIIVTGGQPPYQIFIFDPSNNLIGSGPFIGNICPGTYTFEVRDVNNTLVTVSVPVGTNCCNLVCKDTVICYNLPDSLVKPPKPLYKGQGGGAGTGPNPGTDPLCTYDSIWNNAPLVYPVGTTVVKWYVLKNGFVDSCSQNIVRNPPSAYNISFTTSPPIVAGVINICNGQSITFNDNSTGITGLLWNFGNGYYSTNATHTEPAWHYPPGTYYDTLTVFDACGVAHDTAFTVVVDSASGPDIFCISVVCPGDTVTYHTSAVCTGYTWTVSGGSFLFPPSSTSDSCVVVWGAGPAGTITLAVTGCTPPLNCPNPTVKTINIVPATLPIAGDTIVCAGTKSCYAVECIPGNNHSWEVFPANAGTVTGQGTCEICIEWAPGFFGPVTIQLNYQNVLTGAGCNLPGECKDMHGCGGTATITVDVRPIFGISGPSQVCPNTVSAPFNGMNLTNNTIAAGVSWKLVTPAPSVLTFANSALLNAYTWNAGPGVYELTAYAPANTYCTDSAKVNVTVVDMLVPGPITGPDTVCANVGSVFSVAPNMTGVSYLWTITNGTITGPANGSSVTVSFNAPGGSLSVVQYLSASPSCTSQVSLTKNVVTWPAFPLPVVTASSPTVCMNSTITYSIPTPLLSNATYTWSIVPATAGNILSANGGDSIVIKWISAAITPIFVKLKISRCYEDSVMVPINLLPLPTVPNISYFPANPCVNTVVNFTTANPGPSWNWSFGDAGTSVLQNPSHVYTAAGNYNVQLYVTNASGCSDTATTAITVEDVPVVPVINGPDSVCINSLASYNFSQPLFPGAYYSWSLSNSPKGIISSSGNNFMNLKWTIAGTDTVKVRVQANCLDTTIKYVVVISPLPTPGISVVSPACQNSNVAFTGTGGGTYAWTFAGGSPGFSSVSNPVVTYGVPGSYNVSLSVVSAAGCAASTNTTMVINPEPNALINGPATICAFPGNVTMSAVAQPGYTFLWTPTGSTSPSITTTISSLTTFSCVVTNSFGCTKLSNSITVDTLSCVQVIDSCNVNDSIDFTYTPPICLTQTYTKIYTGTLTGWSFGPGGSAGAVSPVSATYPFPGIFAVTVTGVAIGTYPDGSVCTKNIARTRNVTIPFDPDFDFKYQCNGSNVMQVLFTNTSKYLGSAAAYNWTWFDVTTASTLSTNPFPPAITLSAGSHVINLSVFDPVTGASCTITKTINVPVPIVASFTVSSPLCVGAPNAFTNTSVTLANQSSMLFNNGNGGTAISSPASIPYANSGSFTATLSVTDIFGCTSSSSQPVSVLPAGSGTITVGALACDSVSLTASGPGPFTWNVISPPPVPNNPAYVKTSGYYSVTGIGVNGCPYTAGPVQVTVNKSPQVTITGQTQYCQGEALNIKTSAAGINYAWIRLPSTPVGGNSPNLTIIANTPGTFTYQVTVTAANGCTGSATYTITVDPVPGSASIVANGPLTFCQGDSVKLTVSPPGFSYLWSKSPAPQLTAPANAQSDYWATQSGTYSVIVTTANGCAYPAIAPVVVTVNPVPPANITGDTTLCQGETLTLNSTPVGGATYTWTGPGASGNTNPFVKTNMQPFNSGYYVVTVTNTFGCSATDSVDVIVYPGPVAPIINSNPGGVLCEGQLFNLFVTNPTGGQTYGWSTGQLGLSINAVLPGDYFAVTSNIFGCTAQSNILTIHPKPDLSCVPTGCYEFCTECDSVIVPGPAGLFSYQWELFNGINFSFYSGNQNLTVLPPGGKFRLIAATQWGCADSTDTLSVDFMNCCPAPDTTTCADACVDFDNNNLSGWQPYPIAPNVGLTVTNIGSQNGPADYFIQASDLTGPSFLEGSFNLLGKWCCGEFCFDYKLIDDAVAGSPNVNPQFTIFNGTLGFRFTASASVNENSPWQRFCAPISDCAPPPVSPAGTWAPIAGTVIADWTTVLSNVTNVVFKVDYTAGVGETSGYDNVCIQSGLPSVSAGNDTTVCAGSVITLHADSCNGTATWYQISGDSLVYVGNGPIVDVTPQQNTCYVLICCNAGACCCDTDTVCINVNPLPILKWTTVYPSVCQNSAPIFLDSSNVMVWVNNNWVPVSQLSGTGSFSGPFVTGNYFNPTTIGTYTICYTWTDSLGCSATVCNTISVQFCCDTTFQINAGADTTICAGGVVTLTVTGCTGSPQWFKMTVAGPVPVGQGPIFDAFPQTSTCYMVVCCDPLYPACCDTDTVCINVLPHPTLSWPTVYPNICNNGGPITLNPADVLVTINNITLPVTQAGGTGSFSGPGVSGNIFTPPGIGSYTICYTWTDSLGCSATVCNTITVEFCCDTTFQINAGADTTICAGGVVTLTVTGCTGSPQWFKMTVAGPVPVGQGPIFDAFPQTSTCYMVVCCDPLYPACCDTDTVCINVLPHPTLSWPTVYPNICNNGGPITLNPADVLVTINNITLPVTQAGGTGSFSGPGVSGNIFTPPGIGSYTICYTWTDSLGCSSTVCNTITVEFCCDTTFQINAGADTTICAGGVVTLTVTGCTGSPQWFKMTVAGPVPVGQGPIFDAFPQTSTCYMVVCCDPLYPACCDTDTVCINVLPHPTLSWPTVYPNICNNGGPITLNPADVLVTINNITLPVTQAGGTGSFSGPGVSGNIFTPPGIGSYTICYTWTDSLGCSATVCNTITVEFCCDTTFQINAGADTTICAGGVVVLSVTGCTGTPTWYAISVEGLIPVGQGPIFDAFPQTSTCYVVICCDPLYPACCDTDTVCINVLPHPTLSWPTVYPNICNNGGPITLNPADVLVTINNITLPATQAGGTGSFSGPGVSGNIFTPPGIGSYTICYTWTDSLGCSATVCNTITVEFCCDTTFQINAGADTTICAGGVVVLSVTGCTGTPTWYAISVEGLIPVGQGPIFDAFPQTSTCYMVVCCDPLYPACCDTDTVCINVLPHPTLIWPTVYPNICNNGGPITLNPADVLVTINNITLPVTQAGGTGSFSGSGVSGNIFTPPGIGSYTICYTWTDSLGCSATVCNTITVEFCCDTTFQINAGNDTSICAGGVVTLTVTGCTGTPTWYAISVEGLIPVGQGPIFDAFPQTSTCFVVICCDPLYPACCDTDTVCVTVYPHPILSWPSIYTDICHNGGSITLNPNDIFVDINNTWVMSGFAGGTGVFSGPGIVGNTFTPPGPGSYVITFTYTDPNGCVATISNSITVVFCCDTTYQISAGNDTSICAGGVVTLTVTGCSGTPTWYMMSVEGLIPIAQGPIFDAFPQTSTCYVVICCDPLYPACCDTDTVCVTVYPHPILSWPSIYTDICHNGGSITLNPNDIFVDINNTWVMSGFAGGTGVFSGPGIVGNTFTPPGPGSYVITFTYTDPNGCVATISNSITVVFCCDTTYQISAGNDTSICAGGIVTLQAAGCAGNATWYSLSVEGPVLVGEGNVIDVMPQQSTCYILVCCNPQFPACCDTDTVCVTVYQTPILQWPTIYTEVCYGQGQIVLNPDDILVWVNNAWVPSSMAGGTGVFTGPGVFGNIFTPPYGNASFLISYTYTFGNGCTATVYNGITVLNCCDPAFNINAGNDVTICQGQSTVLNVNGCAGTPNWYALTLEGPVFAGSGPELVVQPSQSTCYMVICCQQQNPLCCDTDTVCVNVIPAIVVGPMTGTHFAACLPAVFGGSTYSVPAIAGAQYIWNVPSGMTISSGQGTNSINASWTNLSIGNGIVGTICIDVYTPCGWITICRPIDLNVAAPVRPNSISGPGKVCPGDTAIYSVAAVPRASSYNWTVPTGMNIISGAGTNIIQVAVTNGFTGGTVSVTASNICGTSPARTKAVTLNLPTRPGVISGPATGMCGTNGAVYTISAVPGAVSYFWTVTNGTIIGSNTGLTITVNWSPLFTTGTVTVYSINGCGISAVRSLTVTGAPAQPGPITGSINVCTLGIYRYSIPTVTGASTYQWSSPAIIINGQGTKEVDVYYNIAPAGNQVITVRAENTCGLSAIRTMSNITISSCVRLENSDYEVLSVQPNPSHEQAVINFLTTEGEEFTMQLFDAEGRLLINEVRRGDGGIYQKIVPVSTLARGIYLVKVLDHSGTHQTRMIVN